MSDRQTSVIVHIVLSLMCVMYISFTMNRFSDKSGSSGSGGGARGMTSLLLDRHSDCPILSVYSLLPHMQ